jgi:hypothetical protein
LGWRSGFVMISSHYGRRAKTIHQPTFLLG